jgi:kynureninase
MRYLADELFKSPNPQASHYSTLRVTDRLLLTGYSHQAWPDGAFDGQVQAVRDTAELIGENWGQAFVAPEATWARSQAH